jgi:peptide/nickel transport system ATP-binding protein
MCIRDRSVLGATCDRLAVMYAGRVVEEGPAEQLFADPKHPYSAALSAAFPTIGDHASRLAPRGLPGDPPDPAQLPGGCAFHPRCPAAVPACSSGPEPELRRFGPHRSAACAVLEGSLT